MNEWLYYLVDLIFVSYLWFWFWLWLWLWLRYFFYLRHVLVDFRRWHVVLWSHIWNRWWLNLLLSVSLLLQETQTHYYAYRPLFNFDLFTRLQQSVEVTSSLRLASSRSRLSLACLLAFSSSAFFLFSSSEALAMFSKRAFSFPAPALAA